MADNTEIPEGWVETTLGEITKIMSGSTPSTKELLFWDGDISWITPKDLSGFQGTYISRGERNITAEGLKNSSAQLLPINTVLFSSRAPIGYLAIAEKELTTNQGFKNMICDEKISHYKFIFYWLKGMVGQVEKLSSGSTFSEVSASVMRSLKIKLPPIPEQQAIARMLSSFDDKIELLREQNETLEKTAQTIFQEWFIEYGPFKKDLIESEDGLIPRGWKVGKLDEISEITSGKRPQIISDIKTRTYPYPLIGATKVMGFVEDYLFEGKSLVIGRVGTHGEIQKFNERIYPSDNTLVIRSDFFIFVYFILKGVDYQKLNRGAVQPLITQTDIKNYQVIIPSEIVMSSFNSAISPIFEKIETNTQQINILANTRDLLLPRLMNGEVRL